MGEAQGQRGRPRVRRVRKCHRVVLRAALVAQPENPDGQPGRDWAWTTARCRSICANVFEMSAENSETSGSGAILDRRPGSDLSIYKRIHIAAPVADVFDYLMNHQTTLVPELPTAYGWSLTPRIVAAIRPHHLVLLWNWHLPSGSIGSSRISLRLLAFDNGTWLELEHAP